MASSYSELYSLTYTGAVNNSGNGVKAQFDFQGLDRGNSFQVNSTWPVSFDNTDGPMCALMANNQVVSGVTAKILTSAYESGSIYTGTLEMYPLTAGTTYRLQAYSEGGTPVIDITFTPTLNNNPRAKDLASGTLAESVSASTTTLLVYVGEGSASTIKAVWPDTPFYASIMPSTPSAGVPNSLDSEIVKVTAVGNDQVGNTALTVVRAQRGTTGKAFTAGAIVTNADYAEDAVLLGDEGTAETPTPWVGTLDIENGAITDEKIDFSKFFVKDTYGDQRAINGLGTIGVLQIPTTGVWLISWYGRCYWGGTTGMGSLLKIDVGNTPETATTEIYNMGMKNLFTNGDTLRENAPAPVPVYVEAGKYVVVRCPAAANGTITGIVNGAYALRVG